MSEWELLLLKQLSSELLHLFDSESETFSSTLFKINVRIVRESKHVNNQILVYRFLFKM